MVDASTVISVDLAQASPDNILLLESLHNPGDTPTIKVETRQEAQVYAVKGMDIFDNLVNGGDVCSFDGTALEKDADNFVTVPLNGQDVVVYVCVQNTIVGRCIHFYNSSPVCHIQRMYSK